MQPIKGVKNMKFTNTNYKGYPYRVNLQTKGICCSSPESNRQILFTDFKKISNLMKKVQNLNYTKDLKWLPKVRF